MQAGLDAWLPVVLTDYVKEEVPAKITLESAEIVMSDGTDRLGIELRLTAILDETAPQAILDKAQSQLLPPAPTGNTPFSNALPSSLPPVGNTESTSESLEGNVVVRAGIRYDAESKSFYCQDVSAESISFGQLPSDIAPPIKQLCEVAMNRYFSENAVYTIDSEFADADLATSRLKNVTVRDGELVVELGL